MPPAMLSQAELLVRTAVRKPKFEKLDPAALKAVKQFARSSDAHVAAVFDQLWQHLGASHSQERWLSLEVAAELWDRSAAFRHALSRVIPDFVHLVIGDHAEHPLPPPTRWAEQLRTHAHELIPDDSAMVMNTKLSGSRAAYPYACYEPQHDEYTVNSQRELCQWQIQQCRNYRAKGPRGFGCKSAAEPECEPVYRTGLVETWWYHRVSTLEKWS